MRDLAATPRHAAGRRGAARHAAAQPQQRRESGLGRNVGVMAAGTAVSRVLGMVRGAMLVWAIGAAGLAANAFDVANTLPNILVMLIAAGVINAVLVPQVVLAYTKGGGDDYVNRILTLGAAVLLGLTIVLTAAAGVFASLYSRGGPDQTALVTAFAFWCIPQVFFYGMYTLLGQVLNARGSFGPYMWAPVVNNVVAIGGLVLFIAVAGPFTATGPTTHLAWWTGGRVALLAGTATLGVAAQAAVLVLPFRSLGFRFRLRWGVRGVGLRSAARVAGWTFAAVFVGQAGFWLLVRVTSAAQHAATAAGAGTVAGNAAFSSAYLVAMLPHSLVTVSLLTATFTALSAHAARGDGHAVRTSFSSTARVIGVFTVFATAVAAVLAMPLTRVVFPSLHGSAVSTVSDVVVALLIGLAPMGHWSLCQRLYYAYEDAKTLFWIQVAMAVIVAGGTWTGLALLPPGLWTVGAGLATSLSYLFGAIVASGGLRRRHGGLDEARILRLYARSGVAGVVAVAVGWPIVHVALTVAPFTPSGLTAFVRAVVLCVVVGLVMAGVYAGLLRLMHVRELEDLVAPLLRRARGLARRGRAA